MIYCLTEYAGLCKRLLHFLHYYRFFSLTPKMHYLDRYESQADMCDTL